MAALAFKKKASDNPDSAGSAEVRQINIPPPPKKEKKWGKKDGHGAKTGCQFVILLFLLAIITGLGGLYGFRNFCTSTVPSAVRNYRPSDLLTEQAEKRVKALRTAIKVNGIITVSFSERELNALLQKNIQTVDWKGQADITLDDHLSIDYSLPLTGVPGFKGRYLNGSMGFAFTKSDDQLSIDLADGTLNGRNIPGFIRNRFNSGQFTKKVLSAPGLGDLADHLDSLKVENEQLVVTTRKKSPSSNQ